MVTKNVTPKTADERVQIVGKTVVVDDEWHFHHCTVAEARKNVKAFKSMIETTVEMLCVKHCGWCAQGLEFVEKGGNAYHVSEYGERLCCEVPKIRQELMAKPAKDEPAK